MRENANWPPIFATDDTVHGKTDALPDPTIESDAKRRRAHHDRNFGGTIKLSMTNSTDPHNLSRFVYAQEDDYEQALLELRSGRKRSHFVDDDRKVLALFARFAPSVAAIDFEDRERLLQRPITSAEP